MNHNFKLDLSASLADGLNTHWENNYRRFFPTMISSSINDDLALQKLGIDRWIWLTNKIKIPVDDKYRNKNYGDIALEESSSIEDHRPGWTEKPLLSAYIGYYIKDSNNFYLLPVEQIQTVWMKYKWIWKQCYSPIYTPNYDRYGNKVYTTLGWGIPINIITSAGCPVYVAK